MIVGVQRFREVTAENAKVAMLSRRALASVGDADSQRVYQDRAPTIVFAYCFQAKADALTATSSCLVAFTSERVYRRTQSSSFTRCSNDLN